MAASNQDQVILRPIEVVTLETERDYLKVNKNGDYANSKASLLFKVKKNSIRMLRDRGYDISAFEQALLGTSIDEFIAAYSKQAADLTAHYRQSNPTALEITFKGAMEMGYTKPILDARAEFDKDGDITVIPPIYIFFPETPVSKGSSQSAKMIQKAYAKITEARERLGVKHIIIITELPPSAGILNTVKKEPSVTVEFFLYKELGYNPTEHRWVPKHTLLTLGEKTALEQEFIDKKNGDSIDNLTNILKQDIICRWYGGKSGDIFKIERENFGIGSFVDSYTVYRRVPPYAGIIPPYKPKPESK